MPTQRLPKEQRRDVILRAAERLFAEQGYSQTRLEDVAADSRVSKQMLSRYFASKQELLLAVVVRHRDGVLEWLATPVQAPDLAGRLAQRAAGWFSYLEENPHAARLLFADITSSPDVAEFYAQMREQARHDICQMLRAEADLDIPDLMLEPAAEMIRAGTVGLAVWWSDHRDVPRDEVVALALRVWTAGLLADRRSAGASVIGTPASTG